MKPEVGRGCRGAGEDPQVVVRASEQLEDQEGGEEEGAE
jgi:hypothetical protein